MKNLFRHWDNFKKGLSNKYIMLFLDYDGTLVPIVRTPDKAVLCKETKGLLADLSRIRNCKLAIISGRDLKDIKGKVGIKGIVYAGNHGFQIEGPKVKLNKIVPAKYKKNLEKIRNDLKKKLSSVKGVFIEDKRLSLSLHYRMVDRKEVHLVKNIFSEVANPYLVKNDIKINKGKKLLEVRPVVDWDKGKAVLWLLSKQKFILEEDRMLPIYIGDDVTDEDAFKVLKNKGISIFVGKPGKSNADFYLKDTKEVKDFLIRILELLNIGKNNGGTY